MMPHNLTLPEEIERIMVMMAGNDMDADIPDDAQQCGAAGDAGPEQRMDCHHPESASCDTLKLE